MHWLRKKILLKFLLAELLILVASAILQTMIPGSFAWVIWPVTGLLIIIVFFVFVSYPFSKIIHEFKALLTGKQYNRIYTKKIDEIGLMAHFFNEVTRSLERVSTDIKEHRRLSSELNVARRIQQDLLPNKAPEIEGLSIIAKTKPAAEIGGDAFDFITKEGQTYMYLGDVTGHGVPSGLVMMIVDTLIHTLVDICQNSHQLITLTNKYLKPRIQTTMFMTMVMLRWDHFKQKMSYTGAGHETIMHYKASEGKVNNIKAGGIALGMIPDNEKLTKEIDIELNEGDFIILYTDGIVEAKNETGERYSIDDLIKLIEQEAPEAKSAEDLFNRISREVLQFLGDFIQEDDMTLMVIQRTTTEQSAVSKTASPIAVKWEEHSDKRGESLIDYSGEGMEESGLRGA